MIKKLVIKNLNNQGTKGDFEFDFHPDLNIFTGKNGCGKTTLLKVIWYCVSGNIYNLIKEVDFDYLCFEADGEKYPIKFEVTIEHKTKKISFSSYKGKVTKELMNLSRKGVLFYQQEWLELYTKTDSFFMPTFRRIESVKYYHEDYKREEYLSQASQKLANTKSNIYRKSKHKFISFASTEDIVNHISRHYAVIAEEVESLQKESATYILEKTSNGNGNATDALTKIKERVEADQKQKEELLKPFSTLSNLIKAIFKEKGIQLSKGMTLGETTALIESDLLSSGEQQMLSFLAYNAFAENTAIFIDEPEISLHPDWQRILLSTLLEQGSNNQFFMATHSPFIYAKYPDKEFILDEDKGGA